MSLHRDGYLDTLQPQMALNGDPDLSTLTAAMDGSHENGNLAAHHSHFRLL